jgi:hypothetical protein
MSAAIDRLEYSGSVRQRLMITESTIELSRLLLSNGRYDEVIALVSPLCPLEKAARLMLAECYRVKGRSDHVRNQVSFARGLCKIMQINNFESMFQPLLLP